MCSRRICCAPLDSSLFSLLASARTRHTAAPSSHRQQKKNKRAKERDRRKMKGRKKQTKKTDDEWETAKCICPLLHRRGGGEGGGRHSNCSSLTHSRLATSLPPVSFLRQLFLGHPQSPSLVSYFFFFFIPAPRRAVARETSASPLAPYLVLRGNAGSITHRQTPTCVTRTSHARHTKKSERKKKRQVNMQKNKTSIRGTSSAEEEK